MSKFANACIMSFNEWDATIPVDLPEPNYSKKHIRRMNALINKMRDNVYHHFTTRAIKIMLVAAVLFALLLTAFVIPSSREFIIDNLGIYSTYQLTEDNGNSVSGEISVGYIPERFKLETKETLSKCLIQHYKSPDNLAFTICKKASSAEIDFDSENSEVEKITIDNLTYTYCKSQYSSGCLIWIESDYIYQIYGQISKDEMLKIAETVK